MLPKLIWRSRNSSRLEDGQLWFDLASSERDAKRFSCLIGKGEREHPDWVPFQKLHAPDGTLPACLSGPVHFGAAMKDPETFLDESAPLLFSATFASADEFVQRIAERISEYFPETTTLSVTAWAAKPNGIPFHARYLITDKAGVALDYGSDLGTNRRTDVALMPPDFPKMRLKEFEKGHESPFPPRQLNPPIVSKRLSCLPCTTGRSP